MKNLVEISSNLKDPEKNPDAILIKGYADNFTDGRVAITKKNKVGKVTTTTSVKSDNPLPNSGFFVSRSDLAEILKTLSTDIPLTKERGGGNLSDLLKELENLFSKPFISGKDQKVEKDTEAGIGLQFGYIPIKVNSTGKNAIDLVVKVLENNHSNSLNIIKTFTTADISILGGGTGVPNSGTPFPDTVI